MSYQRPNHVRQTILESQVRGANTANPNLNDWYESDFSYADYRSPSNQRTNPQYRYQTLTDNLRWRQRFMPESPPNPTFYQPPQAPGSSFTYRNTFNGDNCPPFPSREPRLQTFQYNTQRKRENSGNTDSTNFPATSLVQSNNPRDSNNSAQELRDWSSRPSERSPQAGPSSIDSVNSRDPRLQSSHYKAQSNTAISSVGSSPSNTIYHSNNSPQEHSDGSSHPSERSPQAGPSSSRDSIDLVNSPMSTTDDDEEDPYVRLAKRTVRGTICKEIPKPRPASPPSYPLEDAYSEYLKCVPIPPRSETQTEPFTSSDPLENRDNSPTRWGKVRELKDDDERKTFAREQFGNQESANPAQNLTYHGYRRTVEAEELGVRFRPHGDYYSSNFVHIVDGVLEYIDPSRYLY